MSIARSYVVSVQCDYGPHLSPVRGQFVGRNENEAHKLARDAGWRLYLAQWKAKCPHCAAKATGATS